MSKPISPTVDQAKAALAGVQSMFQDLLKQRDALRAKRLSIFEEREALLVQPFTKAEVLQAMCEVIDVRANHYLRKFQEADLMELMTFPRERGYGEYPRPKPHDYPLALCDLNYISRKPEPYARDAKKIENRPPLKDWGWHFPVLLNSPEVAMNFNYFFFGDIIKKKLCAVHAGSEDGVLLESGLPDAKSLQDRRNRVDELSESLQKVDQELSVLQQDIDAVTAPVLSSAQSLCDSRGTEA